MRIFLLAFLLLSTAAYSETDSDTIEVTVRCETGGTDHKGRKSCYPERWLKAGFGKAIDVDSVKIETLEGLGSDWTCDAARSMTNKEKLDYAYDNETGRSHLVGINWTAMTWSGHCWGCRGIISCKYSARQYRP